MQVNRFSSLRLLLAGCGSIGKRHGQVLRDMGAKNLFACDPSEEQRNSFRALLPEAKLFVDYEEALAAVSPDAVFILTPTAMHLDMAMKALKAGCHVFIEKPLAPISDGVEELKTLAREKGLHVMVGFCFRYHEVLLKAKKLLEEGTIGRLINIRAMVGEPFAEVQPNYLNMYYSRYSGAFELVHDLDLALWYSGQKVKEVYSVNGPFSDMGMQSPDSVEILLGFEDRMAATVHLDFYQYPRRRQMELMGVKGTIIVEFASWDEATLSWYNSDTRVWNKTTYPTKRNDMFRDEDTEFLRAVLGEGEIICTVDEALRSLRVVEKVCPVPERKKSSGKDFRE